MVFFGGPPSRPGRTLFVYGLGSLLLGRFLRGLRLCFSAMCGLPCNLLKVRVKFDSGYTGCLSPLFSTAGVEALSLESRRLD